MADSPINGTENLLADNTQVPDNSQVPSTTDTPVVSPEQDTGMSSYAPAQSLGASASYAGPTAASHTRATGMIGQIDQRVANYAAQDEKNTQNEVGQYQQAVQGEKSALGQVQGVDKEYDAKLGELDAKFQALNQEAARQEQDAQREAKLAGAEFMGKYQQQLAAVRAMSVDISGPLSKLSTAEKGGLSLALFAQGFLAAQGININVSGQVDHWVERSIQEQQRRIGQAEQGAQDTLNLWQIARQNSHDDLEARQRYRGYILEGLKSQTELAANRFQSRLASAQAGVTIAHLGTESQLTAAQMQRQHEQRVFEQKKWETTTAFEMEKVNLERQKVALEAQKAAKQKEVKRQIIIDPSDGKAKWVVSDNRINAMDDAKVASKAQADYERIDKEVQEAMNFRAAHAKDQWGHLNVMDQIPEAKRQYDAMVERLAVEMGKTEFGTRASDKEADRIKKLVPFDKWYQEGDNAKIWNKYREDIRSDFQSTVNAHADAIPEEMQYKPLKNTVNPGAKAEYTASSEGGPPVNHFASEQQAEVVGKGNEKVGEHSYGSNIWKTFVTSPATLKQVEAAGWESGDTSTKYNEGKKVPIEGLEDFAKPLGLTAKDEKDLKMPGWAVAIDHLANGYAKPEETKKFGDKNFIYYATKNDTPAEIKNASKQALQQIASGQTEDGKDVPEAAQAYAKFILLMDEKDLVNELNKKPGEGFGVRKYK